jgi:dTDP-glucose 4,6-dehydratase
LIPLAITNVLTGKKIPIYGDGAQVRDWLYVEDHCRAIDLIIHKGTLGETYCVGGNGERTNKELLVELVTIMGKDTSVFEYVTDRPGHDRRYAINFSKLQHDLGWKPETTLTEGLRKTVDWYIKNENWWKSK